MSVFVPFDEKVEVYSDAIFAMIKAFPVGEEKRHEILKNNGLDLKENTWYSQQKFLSSLKDLSEETGREFLEKVGETIPEYAVFPDSIVDLENALKSLDTAYKMNHRNGEIGYYKVTSFDAIHKKAEMVCKNPYPSEFDLGLIKTLVYKFLPKNSFFYNVQLDKSKETRQNGADSCTYIITW